MYVFNSETKASWKKKEYLEWISSLRCCQRQHLQQETQSQMNAQCFTFTYFPVCRALLRDARLESHFGSLWGPQILKRAPSSHRINTSSSYSHAAHQ